MEAREDAFVDEVPDVVCSERMVVPCAMQALTNSCQSISSKGGRGNVL